MKPSEYKKLISEIELIKESINKLAAVMLPGEELDEEPGQVSQIDEILANAEGMTTAEKVAYFKSI